MLEQLQKNPLSKDREKSMEFLNEFYSKNSYLSESLYGSFILRSWSASLWGRNCYSDGMVDIDEFLEKRSEFPDELKKPLMEWKRNFIH